MSGAEARQRTIASSLVRYADLDVSVDEELSPESAGPDPVGLDEIWRRLVGGHIVLVGGEGFDDHVSIIVEHRESRRGARSSEVRVLERVFRGEPQKMLAGELGVSVATITRMCMTVLRKMGAPDQPVAGVSVLLVMAAHAASGLRLGAATAELTSTGTAPTRWRVSAPNPAIALRRYLSPSEYAVASLAVQGETDSGIALRRSTSPRTIANQVAASFRKLRVQRRSELRAAAVLEHARLLQESGRLSGTALHH